MLGNLWAFVDALCYEEFCDFEEKMIGALLAAKLLRENDAFERQIKDRNKKQLRRVVHWLTEIVRRGHLHISDRVECGRLLSIFSDPRPGIGIAPKTGLPDILWCPIPGGTFQMGEGKDKHPVSLDPYFISRYPITQRQFNVFVEKNGYENPAYWKGAQADGIWEKGKVKGRWDNEWRNQPVDFGEPFHLDNHPVVGITWYEMLAFCEWLNQQLQSHSKIKIWQSGTIKETSLAPHLRVLLPSEAEWERAARAGHECRYPWGDEITPNHANFDETGIDTTSSVGCFPAGENNYGLLDMSGNVWEWTRSHYQSYPYKTNDGRERLSAGNETVRVVRGGSFFYIVNWVRCASRYWLTPSYRNRNYGFRVVLSPVDTSVL
jgi:formylglycine-generating enzyme required for sulfatase activity